PARLSRAALRGMVAAGREVCRKAAILKQLAYLEVTTPELAGHARAGTNLLPLVHGRVTVGRSTRTYEPDLDLTLSDRRADESESRTDVVSREHCTFELRSGRWYLRDTSRNGTYLRRGNRTGQVRTESET